MSFELKLLAGYALVGFVGTFMMAGSKGLVVWVAEIVICLVLVIDGFVVTAEVKIEFVGVVEAVTRVHFVVVMAVSVVGVTEVEDGFAVDVEAW